MHCGTLIDDIVAAVERAEQSTNIPVAARDKDSSSSSEDRESRYSEKKTCVGMRFCSGGRLRAWAHDIVSRR